MRWNIRENDLRCFSHMLEDHMDACYRETREKMNRRKEQGAIVIEMECAGMQAMCDFRKYGIFSISLCSR